MSDKIDLSALLKKFKSGEIDESKLLQDLSLEKECEYTYKVSEKGAISFYGIRSRPITLYLNELNNMLEYTNTYKYKLFLYTNKSNFSTIKKPITEYVFEKPVPNNDELSIDQILSQVKSGEMEDEKASLLIKAIANADKQISVKLSEKKAISFYGIRKLPITLYYEEILIIKDKYDSEDFSEWIESNKELLK